MHRSYFQLPPSAGNALPEGGILLLQRSHSCEGQRFDVPCLFKHHATTSRVIKNTLCSFLLWFGINFPPLLPLKGCQRQEALSAAGKWRAERSRALLGAPPPPCSLSHHLFPFELLGTPMCLWHPSSIRCFLGVPKGQDTLHAGAASPAFTSKHNQKLRV